MFEEVVGDAVGLEEFVALPEYEEELLAGQGTLGGVLFGEGAQAEVAQLDYEEGGLRLSSKLTNC